MQEINDDLLIRLNKIQFKFEIQRNISIFMMYI